MKNTMQPHKPGDGYWIAPTGHVLRLATRHIAAVCQRPEAFGMSMEDLRALFAAHGEGWATERNARDQVIRYLVGQAGWIRVRDYHRRHGYWSFNLPALEPEQQATVGAFFRILGAGVAPDDRVRLDAPGQEQEWTTVRALSGTKRLPSSCLTLTSDIYDLPLSSPSRLELQ